MNNIAALKKEMKQLANPGRAKVSRGFFKTGPGEYGESDVFFGITVPQARDVAKKYQNFSFGDIENLLQSKVHEERLVAVLLLVHNFQKGDGRAKTDIFKFYLSHARRVNNWDLVDISADKILGDYLLEYPKQKFILKKLARSGNIWERRIAIIATFQFIKQNRFLETLAVAEALLHDTHDLIHKAVGWMLREVGKRSLQTEEKFLKKYCKKMPRTMLRYAVERFPERTRRVYMA